MPEKPEAGRVINAVDAKALVRKLIADYEGIIDYLADK
jgi:hypothetical protein